MDSAFFTYDFGRDCAVDSSNSISQFILFVLRPCRRLLPSNL